MFDNKLWGQVRDNWRDGTDSEKESGGKQAEVLDQLPARIALFEEKLDGNEIGLTVGIMGQIWNKGEC